MHFKCISPGRPQRGGPQKRRGYWTGCVLEHSLNPAARLVSLAAVTSAGEPGNTRSTTVHSEDVLKKIIALALAGGLVFGAVSAQTITVAMGAGAVTFVLHDTNVQPTSQVSGQICDSLVGPGEGLEVDPGLAESWEAVDDTTWVFNLRDD